MAAAGKISHDESVAGDEDLLKLFRAIVARDLAGLSQALEAHPDLIRTASSRAEQFLTEIQHQFYRGDTALHIAAASLWPAGAHRLLEAGADVATANRRGAQPLHYAVDSVPGSALWDPDSQVEVISCLLASGADPSARDKNGTTPLHRAVRNRCAAAVARLLEEGADPDVPNRRGSTARQLAQWTTGRGGSGLAAAKDEQDTILHLLGMHEPDN